MAQEIRVQPKDPESARAEIERTRARMSETLDQIEDVLLVKKARIREQLDIVRRIREKPLHAAGIVFGAGLILGFLTGGDDGEADARARMDAEERALLWERRARRLLLIARAQEEEIEELEERPVEYVVERPVVREIEPRRPSRIREAGEEVKDRVAARLSAAADRIVEEFHERF